MAKLIGTTKGFPRFEPGRWKESFQEQRDALHELEKVSQSLSEGQVVGQLLYFPVADGNAVYRVVKAKPLTLEHVPYGDSYQIAEAHLRGLRLSDVLEQQRRDKAICNLFPGNRAQ